MSYVSVSCVRSGERSKFPRNSGLRLGGISLSQGILVRCGLSFALCVLRRVEDHQDLQTRSPLLKKTCVRQFQGLDFERKQINIVAKTSKDHLSSVRQVTPPGLLRAEREEVRERVLYYTIMYNVL